MTSIGRNDPCVCGSKKKYKKCCLSIKTASKPSAIKHSDLISKAGRLAREHDKASIASAVDILKSVLSSDSLSNDDRINASLSLAVAYQHSGEHKNAISTVETLADVYDGESDLSLHILHLSAISYGALGHRDQACELFDQIISAWEIQPSVDSMHRRVRGVKLIEAGKAFSSNDNDKKAIECWEKSIEYLEEFAEIEAEHIGRARANIASRKLKSEHESVQQEGIQELNTSIDMKLKIGDLKGVANNYCNLGTYFRQQKRYGRAIAYYRKDLYLSRLVGDKRDLASTLGNFATLYGELKQFKQARKMLVEAKIIAEELNDDALSYISKEQLSYINKSAKDAGVNKIGIGDKAECGCESKRLYVDCCGLADFEPVNIPQIYGGLSEDAKKIHQELSSIGKTSSPLDFILRKIPKDQMRKSWAEHHVHDGWVSIKELPDMASIHIHSAREMMKKSLLDNDLSCALSAVILSICYLEAFINQLSFFLLQNKDHKEVNKMDIPSELLDNGAFGYQRKGSIETKWLEISGCLNGPGWLSSQDEWKQVKDLIYIRNELVHFKAGGYEQVVPPPRSKDIIYSKVPNSVELRDEPHSWPFKLLTGSLALWSVEASEKLVESLKNSYSERRKEASAGQ